MAAAIAALFAMPSQAAAWSESCCLPLEPLYHLTFSSDGRFAYAGTYRTTVVFARDPETGRLAALDTYDASVSAVELSPDEATLYGASGNEITTFARDRDSGRLRIAGRYRAAAHTPVFDLQVSRDGRQLYYTDGDRDAIVTLDVDPATRALSFRSEIRSGDPGVKGVEKPTALALSGDDRFLYVGVTDGSWVLAFAREANGDLRFIDAHECDCDTADLAMTADGRRLYGLLSPVSFVERDPATGALGASKRAAFSLGDSANLPVTGGSILPAPDGNGGYGIATSNRRVYQFTYAPDGAQLVRTYDAGEFGEGLAHPLTMTMSPDGHHVYVLSGERAARIAVFRRDPATNDLTFASLWAGAVFDGIDSPPPEGGRVPKVTINGGDKYTNDPDVELTIADLSYRASSAPLLIANNPLFEGAEEVEVDPAGDVYPWTLDTSGPPGQPRGVYVKVTSRVESQEGVFTDEILSDGIVLDELAPTVKALALRRGGRVTVRARDQVSGLARMQVTRSRGKPGTWRPYARTARVSRRARVAWVRVRDRAGNRSKWRRATR